MVYGRRQPTYREKRQKKQPGEKPTSPNALHLPFPTGTTTDLPEVPDEGRRYEPDDEEHPTGRCQAGNTQVSSYSDPESRIQICETCYQREKVPVRNDNQTGFARLVGGPVPSDGSGMESLCLNCPGPLLVVARKIGEYVRRRDPCSRNPACCAGSVIDE